MPLSQILIGGEGWKKVEGKEKPKGVKVVAGITMALYTSYTVVLPSGKGYGVGSLPGVPDPKTGEAWYDAPTAAVLTLGGDTLYVGGGKQRHLWAYPIPPEGETSWRSRPAPYAPLRVKRGEFTIAVTSLATDADGRIYAATEIGVQVFDPTGRLCGVLTPAAEGKPEHLSFEGDLLTHWIGDTKYARKLNATGAK
jgi:hypothetical protein